MSLILRKTLTRPLTHDELDGNLVYLNIAEWIKKGYLKGQYVLIKSGSIGTIYYCEATHTEFVYDQYGGGNFILTYLENGVLKRIWRQIGSTGGGGSSLIIEDEGVELIQRSVLNFVGPGVSAYDDPINNRTIVEIDGSGGLEITGGTTNAGIQGTTDIKQILTKSGGGQIIIDFKPAFTFKNTNPVKKTVGGIELGTTPFTNGKTMHQIIQEIFYPPIEPAINYSSVFLFESSPFNPQLIEIGFTDDLTLNSLFTKGKSVVSGQPDKFMGNPIKYNYSGEDIVGVITNFNSALTDTTTLLNYTVIQGMNEWQVAVDYSTGEQPVYDTGDPYTDVNFTNAGTVSAPASFEGVYPLFATSSDISVLTKQPLVSMLYGNNIQITLVAEPEDNSIKHKFEIPNAWLTLRPLIEVNYFNTVSNQFDPLNKINEFSTTQVVNIIQGNIVNYTRYTHTGLAAGLRLIRLRF